MNHHRITAEGGLKLSNEAQVALSLYISELVNSAKDDAVELFIRRTIQHDLRSLVYGTDDGWVHTAKREVTK